MHAWTQALLQLALDRHALRFGDFTLKSGRRSPYFFNAGDINDGEGLNILGHCYAAAVQAGGTGFDMLYGPAYKGIPLATAMAVSLARDFGRNVPVTFNRKEAKDHGEGGHLIGAPLAGRVLVVDDVISAGTSVRESGEIITAAGATVAGVVIALDRQERGRGKKSAVDEVRGAGVPVVAVATLDDLIAWMQRDAPPRANISAMIDYRSQFGA